MKTFSQDHTLQQLPVPELQATCAAVLELVAPLVDESTLADTKRALEELGRAGGAGELLQTALKDRQGALPGNSSWLRPFWDDMYKSWREPLPVNMNYFLRFAADRWGSEAALPRLVRGLATVIRQLANEELAPEQNKAGFLSMDQARMCFYTRIPGRLSDTLLPVDIASEKNIAVTCSGHWFLVPLFGPDDTLISEAGLAATFQSIREQAKSLEALGPIAAFTSAPRATAAALRAELQQNLQNRISLAALERTLFVVCLESAETSDDELALRLLCGDAANRWFDKSLQIIATESGGLGANFEHAGCDAAIWLYLLGKVDAIITDEKGDIGQPVPASCRILLWEITAAMEQRLKATRESFTERVARLEVTCHEFFKLSKANLKSFNTSPDAFLQIAFQTSQHTVFGRLRSAYEAVAVRGFAEGRTECARPCSEEALAFALALKKGNSKDILVELYRQAERSHIARLQRCQRGLGAERHMYGLHVMFLLYGKSLGIESMPAIFGDTGWQTLKHDAMSTSGIGAPFIRYFGFGPVVEDGFGVGYAPSTESTGLVVSTFKRDSPSVNDFVTAFENASGAMGDLLKTP